MNEAKIKFLREGLEVILKDIIDSMPESPTLVGIGIGVVYIPAGDRGKSQVVTCYRTDESFSHQDADVVRDIGESFLEQGGIGVISLKGN